MSCVYCNKRTATKCCGGPCKQCIYCSQVCANAHYSTHALVCSHFQEATSTKVTDVFETQDMLMQSRLLGPGEMLPMERHPNATQFFYILSGSGRAVVDGKSDIVVPGSFFHVPRGALHSLEAGDGGLRLFTIYSPPQHETELK